jgi:hypothetical protein
MNEATSSDEAFQTACQQVGEFLYHFSLLEREIDDGIGKLMGIGAGAVDIVTANIDFARKVNVLRSAEVFTADMPDKTRSKFLKDTFSAIMSLNEKRKIVAHCMFSPGKQSAVVFRRAVASSRLQVEDVEWSDPQFRSVFAEADKATADMRRIIEELVPYAPKLDFTDPRNSMYAALL